MTGDSSGGGQGTSDVVSQLPQIVNKLVSLFYQPTQGSGRMAARGAAALARQMQRQAAKLAAKQADFQTRMQFPESPYQTSPALVTQYDLPVKLTTKQTTINQRLMTQPNNPKLLKKQEKLAAKIVRYERKHPEAATQYAVNRKY